MFSSWHGIASIFFFTSFHFYHFPLYRKESVCRALPNGVLLLLFIELVVSDISCIFFDKASFNLKRKILKAYADDRQESTAREGVKVA